MFPAICWSKAAAFNTDQNRRQIVFNKSLYVCAGGVAWHWKFDKSCIDSVSFFNLGRHGALFGGAK